MPAPEKKVILVTGATGFIGSRALAPLQALGFEVHAAARTLPRFPSPGIHWHASDLLAPGAPKILIDAVRPTHLLHFAWYAEHGKFWTSPANLDWLSATLSLLRAFADAGGRRFVGAGTCAEYDWTDARSEGLCDEAETPLRPSTLYGAAKASTFLTGEAFAKISGIEFTWGRVFHLFGPGEPSARLVPALIRSHLTGSPLDCGPGDTLRDLLPVTSVAHAFAHLCASEGQGAVNIGSGRALTFSGLSEEIAAVAGSRGEIRFGAFSDAGPRRLIPAVSRLAATGWRAPETLESGLATAVNALRTEGALP